MKVLTVIGARPQFVKAAAVSRVLRAQRDVTEILVHTGQHYDDNMSDVFFRELDIPHPDVNLGVGSGHQGAQTARMLDGLERLMLERHPDWVLVYGDTNSTIAGALAAAKLRIPIAHVEAGLRSFNRAMPEEINRVVSDHLSDLLLAPTATAVANLAQEGVAGAKVRQVGDVMYDAAIHYGERAEQSSNVLARYGLPAHGYVLATVHRAENTDDPRRLAAIFEAMGRLAAEIPVVVPLHPRTRAMLGGVEAGQPGLQIIDPVGYLDMVMLERNAALIATDSGGVQKEAFFHGVRCATLRTETEWVELVQSGWNRLVAPSDAGQVYAALRAALAGLPPSSRQDFYGTGAAAQAIVEALVQTAGQA